MTQKRKMSSAKRFFSEEQKKAISEAIAKAEHNTSGEICVHIETKCKADVLDRAAKIFSKLKIDKTKLRNGVLFYLAVEDKKFAVLGDQGINTAVPPDFWNNTKEHMLAKFKEQKFTEGLCEGIEMAGKQLKEYFPHQKNDVNELPNEVSFK